VAVTISDSLIILAKYTPMAIHLHTPKTDTSVHIAQPIYDAHHDTNTSQVDFTRNIFNEKHYKNFKNEITRHTEIYQTINLVLNR